jgi:hypothetical protein
MPDVEDVAWASWLGNWDHGSAPDFGMEVAVAPISTGTAGTIPS